ncbi:MAG TPA: ABC transporter ATP-binding protein [Verrucomicrobiota bacterium]|nr:ABC transporter ATP-binding protein [Verrucomicrobiota bacterium]HNU52047.1 ABC transporter ATP-binding protein [Verrucomicrobiota bacterium]
MTAPREIVRCVSVSKCYQTGARGEVWALRDFNLSCAEGELVCLLGPSGCGKTTLLRLVAGLEEPTGGEVRFEGGLSDGSNSNLGFISQEGDLLPWRTAIDNVALGLEIRGLPRRERHQRALAVIRRMRLPESVAGSYAHELSGGMRQRIALARAWCVHPALLLMDEPFGRLDEPTRHELQHELLDLWMANRGTILFVTHSLEEAVFLADRVVVMTFGAEVTTWRVPLAHPRDRYSPAFLDILRQVRRSLAGRASDATP